MAREKQCECVREVVLTNPLGLHARPATTFVDRASKFQAEVTLWKDGREANGKSIMDLLALGAERGSRLTVRTRGVDAGKALRALLALLQQEKEEA